MTAGNRQDLEVAVEEGMNRQNPTEEKNVTVLALKQRLQSHLSPSLMQTVCGIRIPRWHVTCQILLWIFLIIQVL